MTDYTAALVSLRPGATWSIEGNKYDTLTWPNQIQEKPSESELSLEATRLATIWERNEYQRQRAKEYPDVRLYIDAMVKGDQEQMQDYINTCLAVKAKYPKPE